MEATELMIGNLVRCRESSCQGHRVDFVNEMDGEVGVDGEILNLDMVYPIPLTPEILEKNGFELLNQNFTSEKVFRLQHELFYIETYTSEIDPRFRIGSSISEYRHLNIKTKQLNSFATIRYVHELQNALALCKIGKAISRIESVEGE